jgi:hypothetical protein
VVRPLDGRGRQDGGRAGRDPDRSAGEGDHRHAGERDRAAGDDARGHPLAEEPGGEQHAEHRRRRHQDARRAGGDVQLAPVQQQLVGAHPGRAAEQDRGRVAPLRPAHPKERRHEPEGRRRDPQAGEREAGHAETLHADPDGGERGCPQNDGCTEGPCGPGRRADVHDPK